jgi:hypothetical protein
MQTSVRGRNLSGAAITPIGSNGSGNRSSEETRRTISVCALTSDLLPIGDFGSFIIAFLF